MRIALIATNQNKEFHEINFHSGQVYHISYHTLVQSCSSEEPLTIFESNKSGFQISAKSVRLLVNPQETLASSLDTVRWITLVFADGCKYIIPVMGPLRCLDALLTLSVFLNKQPSGLGIQVLQVTNMYAFIRHYEVLSAIYISETNDKNNVFKVVKDN